MNRLANLSSLEIISAIVHDIPYKHLKDHSPPIPVFSEVESALDASLKLFFREKILSNMRSAYDVVFDSSSPSPVPKIVAAYLKGEGDLVRDSQEIGNHLYQCQTGSNPGGLLTVMDCLEGLRRALTIMKLEKEEGARAVLEQRDGKQTFSITHIRNLMLTKKTKVFKVALFVLEEDGSVKGKVCDQQHAYASSKVVADFFLCDFLGCRLRGDPMLATKIFFDTVEEYANKNIADPFKKQEVVTHLVSELTSAQHAINVDNFLRFRIPQEHRDPLEQCLREQGLDTNVIEKDVTLVEKRLKKILYQFQSGISVIGSPEAIQERTSIESLDEGQVRFEIVDAIKRIGSK